MMVYRLKQLVLSDATEWSGKLLLMYLSYLVLVLLYLFNRDFCLGNSKLPLISFKVYLFLIIYSFDQGLWFVTTFY